MKSVVSAPVLTDNETQIFGTPEDLGDSATESDDGKFQELYEELETVIGTENVGGKFEEIYENLLVGAPGEEEEEEEVEEVEQAVGRTDSFLPPEIYKLHMESHRQRMGILTKYVEKEEPVYSVWARESQQEVEWQTGEF